jgi:hypothetical protein
VGAVTFSLWDWDRASRNDFLGRVTLKKDDIPFNKYALPLARPALLVLTSERKHNILHSFAPGREVLRWFPLYRTKARQGDVVHGELLLRIHHVVRLSLSQQYRNFPF